MTCVSDVRRPARAWWLLLALGLSGFVASLALPWRADDLHLGVGVRLVMALAGVAIVVLVARAPERGPVTTTVGVLGASVLVYPTTLALSASELLSGSPLGAVVDVLSDAGHVLPLTLVQLVPVMASSRVVGRGSRRWETAIVALAVVGVALVGLGLALDTEALLLASTVLWFASFGLAPAATWGAVRGTSGETRHRAVVAAVAAVTPVVVIAWCVSLGVFASVLGDDAAVTALMAGFSAGTLLCGVLTLAAGAPAGSQVLRTRTVVASLDGMLAALLLMAGTLASLAGLAAGASATYAAVLGVAVVALGALPWRRLHTWTSRVVDPAIQLRHELATLGRVADGGHRQAALHALRHVSGDPALEVTYAVAPGVVVGTDDETDHVAGPGAEPAPVPLARGADGSPTVLAHATSVSGAQRLRTLGDGSDLLHRAWLEAQLVHETRRADAAAEAERRRLSQDLHDGLQSRLLGLALRLQLGARALEDPTARLLAEETVTALRSMVEEVRALGGGRLPELLAREGLAPALTALLRPLDYLVELDLPPARFDAQTEATAYFVVGEAVGNALKHAQAQRIRVRLKERQPAGLRITVHDDGCGGADPRMGSGLRGLAERVAASGGVLVVRDAERGTVVEAVLP